MLEHMLQIGLWRKQKPRALYAAIIAVVLGLLIYFGFRWMRRFMMLGYMDSAIGRLRVISSEEAQFAKEHPEVGFTCAISKLPTTPESRRLASGKSYENGYSFELAGCISKSTLSPITRYQIAARPLHPGLPAYCGDQTGILKYDDSGSVEECLAKGTPF
jgi:hypothetical protein